MYPTCSIMPIRRWTIVGVGLLAAAITPAAFAQPEEDDNAPPFIDSVTWMVSRFVGPLVPGGYQPFAPFDPDNDLVHELDILEARVVIIDPDWAQDEEDEVFFLRNSCFVPFPGFPSPNPPPISEDSPDFFPEEMGVAPPEGGTQVVLFFQFTIPAFNGKNQARLLGLIDYDVLWNVLFAVANTNDPNCSVDPCGFFCEEPVGVLLVTLRAIENPVLLPPNPPPFADAGPDQIREAGSLVILDGSNTFDSYNLGFASGLASVIDFDQLDFAWEFVAGPVAVAPVQDNSQDPTAEVLLDQVGVYTFRLTVDDNVNPLPTTDTVVVEIVEDLPENRAPTAVIASVASPVVQGSVVTLDGSQSSDPDGDTLTYIWRQTDQLGNRLSPEELAEKFQPLSGVSSPVATFQAVRTGVFYFRLIVNDGQANSTVLTSVEVLPQSGTGQANVQGDASNVDNTNAQSDEPAVTPVGACGAGALPFAFAPAALLLLPRKRRV